MSKQLFFAFLLAMLGVSVAALQIYRYHSPQGMRGGYSRVDIPPPIDPWQPIPRTPGRIPMLRTDAGLARKLDLADDHLAAESWVEAIHVLQGLLDGADDALVPVQRMGRDGKETTAWTGLRTEAARLLETLPLDGRAAYQTIHGPRAQAMLAQAKQQGDFAALGEVARRYALTNAGTEALGLLGLHHLDRGRFSSAASSFQRLLFRPNSGPMPPEMLFYAALAFRDNGDEGRAVEAWKRLSLQAPRGVHWGDRDLSLAELKEAWDAAPTRQTVNSSSRPESVRSLEYRWHHLTSYDVATRKGLDAAIRDIEVHAQALIAPFLPIAVDGEIVFRSHRGIHSVDARTGREAWSIPSAWSLDGMMLNKEYASQVDEWLQSYVQNSSWGLFENTVVGTLSTDGKHVYAVDDLGIPPYPRNNQGRPRQQIPEDPEYGPGLAEAVECSRLLAVNVATGNLIWSVGGRGADGATGDLNDCYFLGPPLPLDGRLYAVVEKDSELRLACLTMAGKHLWHRLLTVAPFSMRRDSGRRLQAAVPVFADGILVCPTNAGVVVGVDVLAPGLVWAYSYPTVPLTQSQTTTFGRRSSSGPAQVFSEWKAPTVIAQNGRVVFTAPDDPSIHCLNLRDGSRAWMVERADDDLYLAGVFGDQVLLVGKKVCRSLDLATGNERWQLETGLPSGRGVAHGTTYYLPLKSAGWAHSPALYAIDVRAGAIIERTALPGYDVPGNLLFWQGGVVSQTGTAIRGYFGPKDKTQ